jgi:3'-phosphoadenosine 5'-phosphosulfate sulfotransferase (PAPS reductase)/FAD synthetase
VEQLALFSFPEPPPAEIPSDLVETPDLTSYDYYVVAFSGGKDSCSSLLHLIESGVDRSRIELFHHDVDGKNPFFDWPVTTS